MISRRTLIVRSAVVVLATVLAGCAETHGGRMDVSGTVRLEGQPLKGGTIAFIPLDGQDTQSGSPITAGEYHLPRSHGLKPGKYLVRITAGDGKNPADEEAAGPGGSTNIVSRDLIPAEWNTNSKQQREVKADGPNRFDFDIPKANVPKKKW
jgi:hypothetical protein